MPKYKRHYLTSVIVRIDFAESPATIDRELPLGLSASIMEQFPVAVEPRPIAHRDMGVDTNTGEVKAGPVQRWQRWDFLAKDRKRYVRIERDFFLINYDTKYGSFRTLRREFLRLVEAIGKAFPDVVFGRLGFRYVNTFPALGGSNPFDWKGWIRPNRLAILKVPGVKERPSIARAMQELELAYDDIRVRYRFGMPNPDYPSRIKRKQFVLDSDAFCMRTLEAGEIPAMLDECHKMARQFFEDSITDKMRNHLNARKQR